MGFMASNTLPLPPNFEDCLKCKGYEVEKSEKFMKTMDGGGGGGTYQQLLNYIIIIYNYYNYL